MARNMPDGAGNTKIILAAEDGHPSELSFPYSSDSESGSGPGDLASPAPQISAPAAKTANVFRERINASRPLAIDHGRAQQAAGAYFAQFPTLTENGNPVHLVRPE